MPTHTPTPPASPVPAGGREFWTAPYHKTRVLIVEDNVDGADTLAIVLDRGDREVHIAYDGVSGLAEAREFSPDVCILDIGLPGLDGYKLAAEIRKALPRTRLIALTGYNSDRDVAQALACGFDFHIAKPAPLGRLLELVNVD